MHAIAQELASSDRAPVGRGAWRLTELRRVVPGPVARAPGSERDRFRSGDRDGLPPDACQVVSCIQRPRASFERWGLSGSGAVLPLRDPSPPDAARVHAWRKHARDGTLPPIVLWWLAALDMYVVLDGHDRLVAASAEGIGPELIALSEVHEQPIETPADIRARIAAWYEHVRPQAVCAESRAELDRKLIAAFDDRWRRSVTTARSRPGLARTWVEEVSAQLEADHPDRAAILSGIDDRG